MTSLDIFVVVVLVSLSVGVTMMVLSLATYTALTYICPVIGALPSWGGFNNCAFAESFELSLMTWAFIMVLILIAEAWLLSFYIEASPLAAVVGVFSLIIYVIVSFYVSNAAVMLSRQAVFAPIVASSNLLFYIWINLPAVLIFATLIDIGIALTASRR